MDGLATERPQQWMEDTQPIDTELAEEVNRKFHMKQIAELLESHEGIERVSESRVFPDGFCICFQCAENNFGWEALSLINQVVDRCRKIHKPMCEDLILHFGVRGIEWTVSFWLSSATPPAVEFLMVQLIEEMKGREQFEHDSGQNSGYRNLRFPLREYNYCAGILRLARKRWTEAESRKRAS